MGLELYNQISGCIVLNMFENIKYKKACKMKEDAYIYFQGGLSTES